MYMLLLVHLPSVFGICERGRYGEEVNGNVVWGGKCVLKEVTV